MGWIISISCKYLRTATGAAILCLLSQAHGQTANPLSPEPNSSPVRLELTRPARPWEFACALGTRSALFGNEGGDFEAWVYPLKIMRNFHLRFKVDGEIIDAKNLARSVAVRPESTSITYAWDTFSVKETVFTPVHEPGAVIELDLDSTQPIEVEAVFERDFQLEWPATMGGSDIEWNPALHAFSFDETQHKFTALVGSPTATNSHTEFSSNYANAKQNSFGLGISPAGRSSKRIIIAASFEGLPPAETTYRKLANSYPELLEESSRYYRDYLATKVKLVLPDAKLQQAYEWAQVSVLQGLVQNPYLGTGLVAGFKESSDDDQRPGYAWFFGRDALWTSLALDAEGDTTTTRTALEFLSKYQRADGKITHEIAQGASFVPWFQSMPYAYAAADATPLYIVAMADYVRQSGDSDFARTKWDSISRAYSFLLSTYDPNGFPKNEGVGHGWVEGGPLLPVKNEFYQAAVAVQALQSLSRLGHLVGKEEESSRLATEYESAKAHLNQAFWMSDLSRFAFALDGTNKQVETRSVLSTVPMWFDLLDFDKSTAMIKQLDGPEMQTSWGMRIIRADDPKYDAAGYHNGTVWPLFTGWASVGEYRYHQPQAAYANLRSNALLTFDGSLGHVAEVLSGSYYQTLSSGSPHQIWSSAMVIAPLLTGMLGLQSDAINQHLSFAPHVPSDWRYFAIENLKAGTCQLSLQYQRSVDQITLKLHRTSGDACSIDFSPALSLRSEIVDATLDGHKLPFHLNTNTSDQHASVHLDLKALTGVSNTSDEVVLHLRHDFGLSQQFDLPSLGSTNSGLRILSETWNNNLTSLTIETAPAASSTYDFELWNPDEIVSVEGARIIPGGTLDQTPSRLRIDLSANPEGVLPHHSVVVHFRTRATPKHKPRDVVHPGGNL